MSKFDDLVNSYGEHNKTLNSLKKECDSEKEQIKSFLLDNNLDDHDTDKFSVKLTVSERQSVDEDKLLSVLKQNWIDEYGANVECPYIKTREYVDMEQLETVLYNNEMSQDMLDKIDSCITRTEVKTLRCSKVKKEIE